MRGARNCTLLTLCVDLFFQLGQVDPPLGFGFQGGFQIFQFLGQLLELDVIGACGGLGFTLAIVLFASVRERVSKADCPESFKGFPITLISAGLLALAFMGFSGLKIF